MGRSTPDAEEAETPSFYNRDPSVQSFSDDEDALPSQPDRGLSSENGEFRTERLPSRSPHWLDVVWNGPSNPRPLKVTMFAEKVQRFPANLHNRLSKRMAYALVLSSWISWFIVNVVLVRHNIFATVCFDREKAAEAEKSSGHGKCLNPAPSIYCGTNEDIWRGPGSACGLDGESCMTAREGRKLDFRCPPNCEVEGYTYRHWAVGNVSVMREPVVVGGGDDGIYRGDSFICASALHAGIISRYTGGCGQSEWTGPHTGFPSVPSKDGRFNSFEFDADFPSNFRFTKPIEGISSCHDIRGVHILVNSIYMLVAAYFLTSPRSFLGTLGTFGFWTVTLASNPPWLSGTPTLNAEFSSLAFARFSPCCLGLIYVYYFATKSQLEHMPANLSRMSFWGTGFVMGVLENFVFGASPIDRLIISDLKEPGALVASLTIIGIVSVIVVGQAYGFWSCGKFRPYFKAYILGIVVLVLLGFWPDQTSRIHHYVLALGSSPGTCLQTTPSLFYQGSLSGLYIAGVARWDFDSLLQTTSQLNRGDSAGTSSDPTISQPDTSRAYMYVEWEGQPSDEYDGYSVVINDVERAVSKANKTATKHGFNSTQWIEESYDSLYGDNDDDDDDDAIPNRWYVRVAAAVLQTRPIKTGPFSTAAVFDAADFDQ